MIREATTHDVDALLALITELAVYEREPDAVQATPVELAAALRDGICGAFVAEVDDQVVGLALWYRTFSTWTGRVGVHLEDLYVQPQHRGTGLGRLLLARCARLAVDLGAPRLDWQALDWNTPAHDFYLALGAEKKAAWIPFRLTGEALERVAAL